MADNKPAKAQLWQQILSEGSLGQARAQQVQARGGSLALFKSDAQAHAAVHLLSDVCS